MQFGRTAVLLDHALESRNFEVARVACPLQHLEVEDGGDVFHRGAGEHFTRQVQHDHGGREALRNGAEESLGLRLVQAILQVLDEWRAVDGALVVKGQAEVLCERAFTGTIEAGHPDTDLVLPPRLHCQLHAIEKLAELLLNALGDHVLGDLSLEAAFLRGAIGDDLLNGPIDVLAWVE